MQINSFFIMNFKEEILFCCHSIQFPNTWEEYLEKIQNLIPIDSDNEKTHFFIYEDVSIGIRTIGQLKIFITAPSSSILKEETSLSKVLDHFSQILSFVCVNNITQEELSKRDTFIHLQMILQQDFTPNGYLRMLTESEFELASQF